ncbi:MAG: MATE family efflux transporter [Faecalibacterium sp.]
MESDEKIQNEPEQKLNLNKDNQRRRQEILSGNTWKTTFSVCGPMALFQLINQLFRLFDLAITAQIDATAVSAVSFFSQISNTVNSIGVGFAMGVGILVASYYGAGNYKKVKQLVNSSFCLALICALVFSVVLINGSPIVLSLANTPDDLINIGLSYYKCEMLGLAFAYFNSVFIAIEKARGNGKVILKLNLLLASTKVFLSVLFIIVLHGSVVMVSCATLIANLLVTLCGIYRLRDKNDVFGFSFSYISLRLKTIGAIFRISLPVIAEKLAFSSGKVMVNAIGVDYGTEVVGALGVSNCISAITTTPTTAIGDGAAAMISQNLGNENKTRALVFFRTVLYINLIFGTLGLLITIGFLNPIILAFSSGDPAFALNIKTVFTLEMYSNVFLALNAAVMGLLYGFGYTKLSFLINFSRLFVFRLPVLLLFKYYTDISGYSVMGLVMMISNGLTGIVATIIASIVLHHVFGKGWLKVLFTAKASATA